MKVTVLMSTYNGVHYIKEQLDSIVSQQVDAEISILVRDDGSKDGTQELLSEYQKEHKNVKWYQGENKKPARSFWELLKKAKDSDYYSFADQDDVWDSDKLDVAIKALSQLDNNNPLLYFSDVRPVNVRLKPISDSMVNIINPTDYASSLLNNICPGCTYVFNEAARKLAAEFDDEHEFMYMHDWKLYKIVACFGHILFDKSAHMSYRQHGANAVGAKKGKLGHIRELIKKDKDPKAFLRRKKEALSLENVYGEQMNEENRYLTHLMAHYDEDKAIKKLLLKDKRFKYSRLQYIFFKHRVRKNRF